MQVAALTPEASSFYSKIIIDYLNGKAELKPFYRFAHSESGADEALKERTFTDEKRAVLVDTLKAQYAEISVEKRSPVHAQLDALLSSDTFTVTTGHQLCVLTGPVYFIYKIVHTIKLAEALSKKHPGKKVVPVFWMASEDHDFEEIRSLVIDEKKFTWEKDSRHQPVGRLDLDGINELLADLRAYFSEKKEAPDFLSIAEEAYKSSSTLSIATRKLVHALFGKYGLVIIEPDAAALKSELRKVMIGDITANESIHALNKTNAEIEKLKYRQQIHGREINFFYLSDKGRRLISKNGSSYTIDDTDLDFSEAEMLREIEEHPERFSPNVVLRPVYQEIILPNIAYVGGPGELAYWLQLKGVFEAHAVPYPAVLLRNSFALLSHAMKHKWEKAGADAEVIFGRRDVLHVKVLDRVQPTSEKEIAHTVDEVFQKLIDEAMPVDNRLGSMLINQKKANETFFEQFVKQVRDRKKEIHEAHLDDMYTLKDALMPEGTPAERSSNIMTFARQQDTDAFIRFISEHTSAITSEIRILAF